MLNLIFPSLPYQRLVDPMWQEEMETAQRFGHTVGLFDSEQEKLYQSPNPNYPSLYRGWMLTPAEYQKLERLTPLLVPVAMYLASHRADGWYEAIAGFTPKSYFVPSEERGGMLELVRRGCFIKGASKSFGADSYVHSLVELEQLVKKHAIDPDDYLFARELIKLSDQPEQRFFAVHNRAFGTARQPFPAALVPALTALQSRCFYTVDVAYTRAGQPIIIEVGDGQVSDTKEWDVAELYETAINYLAEIKSAT
ncbi:ATP-grasp domain-containing protein [Hymenobacter sp. BT664]|uniref:ATP-grasp domain-containing protein n=1 Tax=Hymenobacter montanus TaxID=2771359 RepID=A0A927BAL7_9BACT|nr:ATP-grasp domain-containing protein [Hymenobacter montanus]MBD2766654.1 ATP-grasp domain-containing protein [Hymenobacter montanus]